MTNLTLKYFVVKARGEVARLILKGAAGKWNFSAVFLRGFREIVNLNLTWKQYSLGNEYNLETRGMNLETGGLTWKLEVITWKHGVVTLTHE